MISISCDKVCLSFGENDILNNISFSLNDGDKLGIIGVNGAGKSSLFKVITGEYESTSGEKYIGKGLRVGLLKQNIVYESSRTILEEAYSTFSNLIEDEKDLEILRINAEKTGSELDAKRYISAQETFTKNGGYEFRGRCKGILKNLGLGEEIWDKSVSSLSGGQKTRLSLSCLLLSDPDILMLDEPTNHLDFASMFWLENYLKTSKKTVLIISHDRYFLDSVVDHVLEIEYGKAKLYKGNYSTYQQKKKTDREIQERHYQNQQKEIKRIESYIEQQRRWNRERNIIAAESRQKMLDKMEKLERPMDLPDSVRMRFESSGESGNDVLSVNRLCKSYPSKNLFSNLTFQLKKGQRLFICGENGCGKSTLIKILANRSYPDSGSVNYGSNVKIGYYDQENQDLNPNNTVLDEIWNSYPNLTQTEIRNTLALFLFKGEDVLKEVSKLSGGEKARLTLAKLMLSKMNLLILDEPTNHLDINSREILENAISSFDGTVIAISHDRYFVNKLATRIAEFGTFESGKVYFYDGTYDDFITFKKNTGPSAETSASKTITQSKEQFLNAKRDLSEQRKRERRLQKAKQDAEKLEKRIEQINDEMSGEAAFDHVRLAELSDELEKAENDLLSAYEIIEELS